MFSRNFFAKVKEQITLSGYFKPDDFEILSNDEAYKIIVSDSTKFSASKLNELAIQEKAFFVIRYRYLKEFHFSTIVRGVNPNSNGRYTFDIFFSPGEYLDTNYIDYTEGHPQILERLHPWLQCLKVELREIYEARKQTEFIEDILQKLQDETLDDFFTRAEADELKRKLEERIEEIEKSLNKDDLNKLTQEQQALQQQLLEMKQDLIILQEQLMILSKKNWTQALLIRYRGWSPNSLKKLSLKNGMQAIIGLLTEGLPDESSGMES